MHCGASQGRGKLSEQANTERTQPDSRKRSWKAKRFFDVCVTVGLLVPALPLCALLWVLVRWRLGRPAIFRQQRPGQWGRPFEMLKFRTMTDARDDRGTLLPDEARLTRLGRFLRASSADELPELWNVLKGDMSLVGPRPLLVRYLERYTPEQAWRHAVRPGITGWAQVNGRNGLTWEQKFQLDLWYVDHGSLALDAWILVRTFCQALKGKGISQEGCATMPEFRGTMSPER